MKKISKVVALGLFCLIVLPTWANVLPPGFIKEFVAKVPATSGSWVSNPRRDDKPMILLTSKTGKIQVLEDPDESSDAVTILDLKDTDICSNGERGLHTAIPHPGFKTNLLIYVFYTKFQEGCLEDSKSGAYNVVARYRMNATTLNLDLESKEELWRGAPTKKKVHNGGAMLFGVDGKLYLTTGDGGESKSSQPLNHTHGSIIRLNDDGSVPEDNPFTSQNGFNGVRCADTKGGTAEGVCSEVFAHGLRNPFRLAVDTKEQEKVKFTISDVGGNYWEELDHAGTDFAGRNYGYPIHEGVCSHGSASRCPNPSDNNILEPFHWYAHRSTENGGCVSGSVHVPDSIQWPSKYEFLFGEFVFKEIYALIEDPNGGCRTCRPPLPPYRNETFYRIQTEVPDEERITDLFFAPYQNTQALYVLTRGGSEPVVRIRFTKILDNSPPFPVMKLPDGEEILTVGAEIHFDGSESSDPDGDELTFLWEFGDGETAYGQNVTHSFPEPGDYTITLMVTDTMNQSQQVSDNIMIGDPPKVTILSPSSEDEFHVGQVFTLRGVALDSSGNSVPDDRLSWEVRQHHADHWHPFMDPTNGNNIELFPAPEPEDFFASTNSYLRIIVTATDLNGLSAETDLVVQPQKRTVVLESEPTGIEIDVENYPVQTSTEIISWQNHPLNVRAKDQPPFLFRSWSDGNTDVERKILIVEDRQQILALYCANDFWFCNSADECCGGSCVANACRSDSSIGPDWPYSNDTIETTITEQPGEGSSSETNDPGNQQDDVEPTNDNPSKTLSLSRAGKFFLYLFCLAIITAPFVIFYRRMKNPQLHFKKKASFVKPTFDLVDSTSFSTQKKTAKVPKSVNNSTVEMSSSSSSALDGVSPVGSIQSDDDHDATTSVEDEFFDVEAVPDEDMVTAGTVHSTDERPANNAVEQISPLREEALASCIPSEDRLASPTSPPPPMFDENRHSEHPPNDTVEQMPQLQEEDLAGTVRKRELSAVSGSAS